MTEWQKLESKRRKLEKEKRSLQNTCAEIAGAETPTDEQRNEARAAQDRIVEINGEIDTVETAIDGIPAEQRGAAARVAGNPHRELFDRASIATMVGGILQDRSIGGVEDELRSEYGLPGNAIHIEQLREVRAVTAAPANEAATANPIALPAFATSASAFLNIGMETVDDGQQNYTAIGSRPAVHGPHADSTQVAEAAAETWNGYTLGALRHQTAVQLRMADLRNNPGADEAWRAVIAEALMEANDKENLAQIVTDVARPGNAPGADTYASVLERFVYAPVDGREATSETDLRMIVGTATLADWGKLFSATGENSAVMTARRETDGVRVSALVPGVQANKQDVFIRRGARPSMVNPLWAAVEIIPDRTTRVRQGEIILNAIMFANRKVTRPDGFQRVQAQHA